MVAPVIQFKRGLLANLPGLQAGEPGFTTDSYDLYVGLTSDTATNKFVGSHRYWTKGTSTTGSGVNLVEASDNGSSFITLASPASLAGIVTYYLPGSQGSAGYVLSNDGAGNLSWTDPASSASFSGIVNFTDTTDNELGNANSGSVQIDGGLGVNKNVTIGQNLNVQGYSEFVGVVTFRGGTIGLGDTEGDNVVVGGEFASGLIPTTDDTYTIGNASKKWKSGSFAGIVTANSFSPSSGYYKSANGTNAFFVYDNSGNVAFQGTIGASQINNSGGNKVIGFAGTNATFENNLYVSGITTSAGGFSGNLTGNLTGEVDAAAFDTNPSGVVVTGVVTATTGSISGNLTIGGDLFVNGSTTQVNTQTLTVEDALIEVGLVNGSAPSTDLDLDLGLLLNYFDGSAKKAAVYWDDSASRIVLASQVSESSGVLSASGYASVEIGSLYVNDCAGSSQVISCTGSTRNLINITIDCGTF